MLMIKLELDWHPIDQSESEFEFEFESCSYVVEQQSRRRPLIDTFRPEEEPEKSSVC